MAITHTDLADKFKKIERQKSASNFIFEDVGLALKMGRFVKE
jgi:hypothetical protein